MFHISRLPTIEVRLFKWPRRPKSSTVARLLGEDEFGRWLGVAKGDPWWPADQSHSGVHESSLVKLVPRGTFWTACFHPADPVIDVDIVLPVRWADDVLEEVDLELDILRSTDGAVSVRDRDEFERVRRGWPMPPDMVTEAEKTCQRIHALVVQGVEPFGTVGRDWLSRFLAEVGKEQS